MATEAQQDRTAAEAVWRKADRIKVELEAPHAAHAAELDSRAHVNEMQRSEACGTRGCCH